MVISACEACALKVLLLENDSNRFPPIPAAKGQRTGNDAGDAIAAHLSPIAGSGIFSQYDPGVLIMEQQLAASTIKRLLLLFLSLTAVACRAQEPAVDRLPVVAGQFYPAKEAELRTNLRDLFARAEPPVRSENVFAVIAPHAGYVYSGAVAASAYNQLDPDKKYDNIFVLGSSHNVAFDGASIYSQGDFITPLGRVKVNRELAGELIAGHPVFSNRTDAHAREHSLEVQLPFLQYRLKKEFRIVPIVLGTDNPETCSKIADALRPFLDKSSLFVISTDLSHYPSYKDARLADSLVLAGITARSSAAFLRALAANEKKTIPNLATSACGWTSVLTFLTMIEGAPDVDARLIRYANSGDTEYGEKDRVVGYGAVAFSKKSRGSGSDFKLPESDKTALLAIARRTIETWIASGALPKIDTVKLTTAAKTNCGAFVTLNKSGDLRGCIGRFDASEPLYKVVQEMAVAAATEDSRFEPVTGGEVPGLHIEISVLTPMRRISSIDEIVLGKHGIYIKKGYRSGTFLPQVASDTHWTKEEFLGHCARDKAGIGWDGWKDAELYVYEALVFGE
jgi:MEMO1 family protein